MDPGEAIFRSGLPEEMGSSMEYIFGKGGSRGHQLFGSSGVSFCCVRGVYVERWVLFQKDLHDRA